jgi:hypothetical protein
MVSDGVMHETFVIHHPDGERLAIFDFPINFRYFVECSSIGSNFKNKLTRFSKDNTGPLAIILIEIIVQYLRYSCTLVFPVYRFWDVCSCTFESGDLHFRLSATKIKVGLFHRRHPPREKISPSHHERTMTTAPDLRILHFNDVYHIEPSYLSHHPNLF